MLGRFQLPQHIPQQPPLGIPAPGEPSPEYSNRPAKLRLFRHTCGSSLATGWAGAPGGSGHRRLLGGSVSDIQVGVTLDEISAGLSRIFEDDPDSTDDVRVPSPRPPSEDTARPHLQVAPALPEVVIESVRDSLGLPAKLAQSPWITDLPTASVAALVVGFAAHMPAALAVGVLAVWAPSAFRAGSALNTPVLRRGVAWRPPSRLQSPRPASPWPCSARRAARSQLPR